MKTKLLIFLSTLIFLLPLSVSATPMSDTDLWDVSNGTVVDATSGALNYNSGYRSDVRDMLGGRFATSNVGTGTLLFKDYMSPGFGGGSVQPDYVHFVEWHTPSIVNLKSFALHADNEGMTRRAFSGFALYTGDGAGNWSEIYSLDNVNYLNYHEFSSNLTPVDAQYFRLEVTQASWTDPRAVGPRILELDGFDTFLGTSQVPEPASMLLFGAGLIGLAGFSRKK
jgi:hypothetical protein